MDILFIADPLSGFKIYKDSTFVMMEAASQRGHRLFFAETGDLFTENEKVLIGAAALTLQTEAETWYALGEKQLVALCDFDAVIMRKDPPFDLEYLYATHLFSQAEAQGAKIFNAGHVLRDMNEKLAILGFSKWIVPTVVTASRARLEAFIQAQGTVILKPLDSMGGDSIFKVTPSDPNLPVILETMLQKGRRTIMAQAFIPEIVDGDKRILVIDGEPVPYALARIPAQGSTRGNLAAGGRGVAQPLSESDWQLAREVGQVLKARGVFLAGLDVIGQHLTEVNVTSPTCFREIMTQTGTPVGEMWIQALENRCGC